MNQKPRSGALAKPRTQQTRFQIKRTARPRPNTIQRQRSGYDEGNLRAALLIVADGRLSEEALATRWARAVLSRHAKDVPFLDGPQGDLFAQEVR